MGKNNKKESPKKALTNKTRVHEISSDSETDKQDKRRAKQGKLNPKKPFAKVDHYSTEESESSGEESDLPAVSSSQGSRPAVSSTISETQYNMLLGCIKKKSVLQGVDFMDVMAKKQGKTGSKGLKGNELKRFLTWKECMLILSKLALTGANFKEMEVFLTSVKIHLSGNTSYQEISADIIAKICNILENVCFMDNVDHGVYTEYFNRRVADLRNRRNYEIK